MGYSWGWPTDPRKEKEMSKDDNFEVDSPPNVRMSTPGGRRRMTPKQKKWMWIGIGVCVLAVTGRCGAASQDRDGGSVPPPSPLVASAPAAPGGSQPAPGTEVPPVDQQAPSSIKSGKYGEPWDNDGLMINVKAPTKVSGPLGSGYTFTVSYVNNDKDSRPFNMLDWKMTDSDGVVSSPSFFVGDADKGLGSGDLIPGGKKTGQVTFELKGGAKPVSISYDTLFDEHEWK